MALQKSLRGGAEQSPAQPPPVVRAKQVDLGELAIVGEAIGTIARLAAREADQRAPRFLQDDAEEQPI